MDHLKNGNSGKVTAGMHNPCWLEPSLPPIPENKLKSGTSTDVVIVGGGLAGLSTAYCLLKSGKKIVLVEDGIIGSGETGRTTAHLVAALDDRYYHLQSVFGKEQTRLIAESHTNAIDFVEQTIAEENISCDFRRVPGYLFLHPTDKPENLDRELKAAQESGLDVSSVNEIPGYKNGKGKAGIKFENQAQFHPMKYLHGLHDAIIKMGGEVYTNTHAKEINEKGITTDQGHVVSAKYVVVATNAPVNSKYIIPLKQFAYRSYVIGMVVPRNSLPSALWWDTGDMERNEHMAPYHYVRLHPWTETHDLLISGGEDHPTGLADAEHISEESRYGLLEKWTRDNFADGEIVYRWSGQVMEPMDSIAYIGRNPWDKENVFIITGDSGNGMTHCTIGGMLVTDLINGRENNLEKIYNPGRLKLKASNIAFSEFMGGLVDYLKTKPDDADAVSISSIPMGEGKVVEIRKEKYGVYRDDENNLHIVGAECTHMGCIIKWNNDEKSWDCPCHGSRFGYDGSVLNGPANVPLGSFNESVTAGAEHR